MIYLFYGDDTLTIKNEIDKIIDSNKIDKINISRYNYQETSYKTIIEDATTISLFNDNKAIIVSNISIFKAKGKDEEKDSNDELEFIKYISNPNSNTLLFFITDKINSNKKIVKLIKEKGKLLEFNEESDINKLAHQLLDGYNISDANINLIIERTGNDTYRIKNEIDKLKIYKGKDFTITRDDVLNLIIYNEELDYNKLVASIIADDKEKAISIYNEFIIRKEEPLGIMLGIAKRIRLIYQVKKLAINGCNDNSIANILGEKPGFIYYIKKDAINYSCDVLLDYIKLFADADYKTKRGLININNWLELFILTK